jgi:hypothetical protein
MDAWFSTAWGVIEFRTMKSSTFASATACPSSAIDTTNDGSQIKGTGEHFVTRGKVAIFMPS